MADSTAVPFAPTACPHCGAALAPMVLTCASCNALVHNDELQRLAAEAERAVDAGDARTALRFWLKAIDLVPPGSPQHALIMQRVGELNRQESTRDEPEIEAAKGPPKGWLAGLGTIGVLLWKFKFILLFILTKAKFLLFGLTKVGTLLSMFASLGLYWALWGWKFALGVVVTTYIHEMGHVFAFRRYGIESSAPMFIPGFGAFVRGAHGGRTDAEQAHISLAGPLWGFGSGLVCFIIALQTGGSIWVAIATWAARINLLNLIPFGGLDGDKALLALSRPHRWLIAATALIAGVVTGELMPLLVGGLVGMRAFSKDAPHKSDSETLWTWLGLILALAWLCSRPIPGIGR